MTSLVGVNVPRDCASLADEASSALPPIKLEQSREVVPCRTGSRDDVSDSNNAAQVSESSLALSRDRLTRSFLLGTCSSLGCAT